uniref:Uncharacterized protein n=1 Tax=Glossina palpalis gambiensis TaxID=67801 RepID=A0A1B0BR36_9MUSC
MAPLRSSRVQRVNMRRRTVGPVGCIDLPNQNIRVRFVARLISSTFTLTQRWSTFGSHESGSVLIGSLPSSLKLKLTSRSP